MPSGNQDVRRAAAGGRLAWQKWRLRIGYDPREGLVLQETRRWTYSDPLRQGTDRRSSRPGVEFAALRRAVTYAFERPALFGATVYDMIAYVWREAS